MGLIVAGMHRSGTSAVARVVEAMGLASGGPEMGPAPDNPRGFFERPDVMQVNDSWLSELGGSWWAPPRTSPGTWRHLDQQKLATDRAGLGLFDPDQGPWYVKDPRISLLMPLWDRLALQTLPAVICLRDPREVVVSLRLRDGMTSQRALALWFGYVRDALASSQERPRLVIDYDTLVESPAPALDALGQFTVGQWATPTPLPTLESMAALVEPMLRRNRGSAVAGLSAAQVDDAMDTYRLLAKAHAERDADVSAVELPGWASEVLDELRETFATEEAAKAAATTIEQLERELAGVASPSEQVISLEEDLRELQDGLGQRLEQIRGLEERLVEEQQARLAAEESLAESAQRLQGLDELRRDREGEVAAARKRIEELQSELLDAQGRLAEASDHHREMLAHADQRVAEIQDALEDARALEQHAGERITALLEALSAKEEQLQQAGVRAEEARAEHALAVTQWLEREDALVSDVARLERERDDERSQRDEFASALEQARMRISEAEERLASAMAEVNAREAAHQSLREQDAARLFAAEVRMRERAESDAEIIARLGDDVVRLRADVMRLSTTLAAVNQESEANNQHLAEAMADREALRTRLVNLAQDLQQSETLNGELAASARAARLTGTAHAVDLAAKYEAVAALTEALGRETAARGRTSAQLERSVAEHAAARAEVDELRSQLESERDRAQRLLGALTSAIAEGQALETQVDGIRASRSYRVGRRLAAPARAMRKQAPLIVDPVLSLCVPGVEAESLAAVVDSGLFDAQWYLDQYPDVAESGVDPLHHFMTQGWQEDRNPGPAFNTGAYRAAFLAGSQIAANPLVDYLLVGRALGRPLQPGSADS